MGVMELETRPAPRILSNRRSRTVAKRSLLGSATSPVRTVVGFVWTAQEGMPESEAYFSAYFHPEGAPEREVPYEGYRRDMSAVPGFLRDYGERLYTDWAAGGPDGPGKVRRTRFQDRVVELHGVQNSRGLHFDRARVEWTCDEDGDRARDRFSVSLQSRNEEDFDALGPFWSGTDAADSAPTMPDWLRDLVKSARADLLAWVPGRG